MSARKVMPRCANCLHFAGPFLPCESGRVTVLTHPDRKCEHWEAR